MNEINLDIIFLQETMFSCDQELLFFAKIKLGWEICASDAVGMSGVLLTGWNPNMVRYKDFLSQASILVKERFKGSEIPLSFLNCYGPYNNREVFWNAIVDGGIFNHPKLIIVGDLKFNLLDLIFGAEKSV